MPKARNGSRSLSQDVYEAVRHDIIHGEIAPGDRLPIADLSKSRGVSLSVVREAVAHLVSEGLLQTSPQQGFWVPQLSVEDLDDLTWTRIEIESIAVAESVRSGDLAWESALVAAHHALTRTEVFDQEEGSYSRDWMAAHSAFHAALAAGCPHPRLLQIRQQLFDASELYRYWSVTSVDGARRVLKEHTRIRDAAIAREVDGTVDLLRQHLERSAEVQRRRAEAIAAKGEAPPPARDNGRGRAGAPPQRSGAR